ncbi:hypothetical protein [Vibrio sp. CB1-14]|uniref:Uncharacterized protein n=1 Tax=Vibrio chaetopteri TaxID=3016528 RepID=A0AAU8BTD1_9VIBR
MVYWIACICTLLFMCVKTEGFNSEHLGEIIKTLCKLLLLFSAAYLASLHNIELAALLKLFHG